MTVPLNIDLIWRFPSRFLGFGDPGSKGIMRLVMRFPEAAEVGNGDESHTAAILIV